MRQSQLKAFHNVALYGGFSRAADALFLTQPAISDQVRKLEQDYDVLLFHRQRKRVQLTPAGETLFAYTKRYFEVEQQIDEFMSESRTSGAGELRIFADSAHHVTDILGCFRKRYPNVTVTLQTGNSDDIVEELRAYNADIGVIGLIAPGRDFSMLDLGTTDIVAFAASDYFPDTVSEVTLEDLSRYPLIFREAGSRTRQKLVDAASEKGVELTPAITAHGREAVREVVASGAGIGFVSQAEYVDDKRLRQIPLADIRINMSESLLHLTQRRDVKVIRTFMDVAHSYVSERQTQIGPKPPEASGGDPPD